jgi:hypothetical protein
LKAFISAAGELFKVDHAIIIDAEFFCQDFGLHGLLLPQSGHSLATTKKRSWLATLAMVAIIKGNG